MKGIGLLCLQFTNMMKKTLCAMKMDYFDDLFGPSVESVDNSKGGIITFVGSLRKAPDKSVVIIVEELHFQNKFAVKVDTNSGQIF